LPVLKVYATQHDAEHGESPPAPEGISFLKEQQWKIALKTEPAVRHRLTDSIRVPATANARPGLQAQVTPPLPGRLAPPSGRDFVIVGDRVTAGQTLAMVQPSYSDLALRLADAEAELTRARLELEQAQSTLQRVQKLAEVEAKSTRELQQAQFAVKSAQARLEAARTVQAALPVTRDTNTIAAGAPPSIPLIAPISGVVVEQSGTAVGQWVPADQPLFTLMDASRLFIQGHVPESAMNRLGNAQRASVELPDGTDSLSPLESTNIGRLVFLSPQVDPKTRTVAIVYEMDNREGRLRVGQQLFLHVETGRAEDALAIPTSALVEEGGIFVAFVQVSGETFQKRELRLGLKDARFVQVLDGIKEGERVVTKGAYAVRLASASSVIPAHGHTH
jgi:cobalt-zinc-cadmium efflux system membrane fusion protein